MFRECSRVGRTRAPEEGKQSEATGPEEIFGRAKASSSKDGRAFRSLIDHITIIVYGSVEEHGEIAAQIDGAKTSPLWVPVTGPALAFDLAVFRRGRLSTHLGIVIRHGLMIHIGQTHAVLEDYRRGPWLERRLVRLQVSSTQMESPRRAGPTGLRARSTVRISRHWGSDFARSRALVSRHRGQPFRGRGQADRQAHGVRA